MEYVEKYKKLENWVSLSDINVLELEKHIATLVRNNDTDEFAKRFDNFMYSLMLANIDKLPTMTYLKNQLCLTAEALEKKISVPQIQKKLTLIKDVQTDAFWKNISIN